MSQSLTEVLGKSDTYLASQGDSPSWTEEPISLGRVSPHPEFGSEYGIPQAFAETLARQFAVTEAQVVAFRWGKLAVVGIPGEPTSELGRRIRDFGKNLGFRVVLPVSHVNGWIGYILTPEDYDRGGYEATLSFHGRETGLRVVEAAQRALKRLAQPREGMDLSRSSL
jgi:hypothetical protein